jgi:methyl-accepting chemotaxis protein
MDQVTQQNAALVEEAAAAAEAMMDQAAHLSQVVSAFKLSATAMAGMGAPPARARKAAHAAPAVPAVKAAPAKALPQARAAAKPTADEWEEF